MEVQPYKTRLGLGPSIPNIILNDTHCGTQTNHARTEPTEKDTQLKCRFEDEVCSNSSKRHHKFLSLVNLNHNNHK